jgi:hypothetical protein
VTEGTTLWGLLIQPAIGLHFPRFALFILIALPLEIFCDLRSRCFACSFSTIFLQLLIGVSATGAFYLLFTTFYPPGERIHMPPWFYPATVSMLLLIIVTFSIGVRNELRRGRRVTSGLRVATFMVTVAFAITAIQTPLALNRALEKAEEVNRNTGTAGVPPASLQREDETRGIGNSKLSRVSLPTPSSLKPRRDRGRPARFFATGGRSPRDRQFETLTSFATNPIVDLTPPGPRASRPHLCNGRTKPAG